MTVTPQKYRNPRVGFYTDMVVDTTPVGAIVPNFKAGQNTYDHNYIPAQASSYPRLGETTGNHYLTNNGDDPAFTHEGYLYCDGSEHNIKDYPSLFAIIGNDYGGYNNTGIGISSGGTGYSLLSAINISMPPAGANPPNIQAAATVTEVDATTGAVKRIRVITPGTGYTTNPTVTIDENAIKETGFTSNAAYDANRPAATYTSVTATTLTGSGAGATFTVVVPATGTAAPTITRTYGGRNYAAGDTLSIPNNLLGNASGVADITVTVSAGGVEGSGATFVLRVENGGFVGIAKSNVWEWYGDQYMGTFKVPDTVTKKIVGNGPVFGSNSPSAGNASISVGTTGGKWYLDKTAQDDYFTLGRIVTSGYDQVTEFASVDIIGQHTVKVTIEDEDLPGVPQHSHGVFHAEPGNNNWVSGSIGDRYLQNYREGSSRITRFVPLGGRAMSHTHGLQTTPFTDNTIATYDALNYQGGAGGNGTYVDPLTSEGGTKTSEDELYYQASGGSGAGTYQPVTTVPDPIFKKFIATSVIGGRNVTTGGDAVWDYSFDQTYTSGSNVTVDISSLSGDIQKMKITCLGGGGSGAAGTQAGNSGGTSILEIGDGSQGKFTATGGEGGKAVSGQNGGGTSTGGTATFTGSFPGGFTGVAGGNGSAGQNAPQSPGWPVNDYPSDPVGGGAMGFTNGSSGVNVLVGGQSAESSQTLTSDGNFDVSMLGNMSTDLTKNYVKFEIWGGAGGFCWANDGTVAHNGSGGAKVTVEVQAGMLPNFADTTWGIKVGSKGTTTTGSTWVDGQNPVGSTNGTNGTASHSGDGGIAGRGHDSDGTGSNPTRNGGGGGAATILYRGTQAVAGGGGGGGAGADGHNASSSGSDGLGPADGIDYTTSALGGGAGGAGGDYGCTGGGGGGGGGGCASASMNYGSGTGGNGGAPPSQGGSSSQGAAPGRQGTSGASSQYFQSNHQLATGPLNENGKATMFYKYNNDYWTAGGGGGAGGGRFTETELSWSLFDPKPTYFKYTVGAGGLGVGMGGQTTGQSTNAGNGQVKMQIGKIIGYTGGQTTQPPGDVIESGSQDANIWDISIVATGSGSGTSGSFKLPTTQVPSIVFYGGGPTSPQDTAHASATCTVNAGKITAVTLDANDLGTGYTESPYAFAVNGVSGGAILTAKKNPSSSSLDTQANNGLVLTANSPYAYSHYLKFGGFNSSQTVYTRYANLVAVDTTNCHLFSIKAARGNGLNGGDIAEEPLVVKYQMPGETAWSLVDTIIDPNADRTDPLIGNVPSITNGLSSNWDGDGTGNEATKWYTYTVEVLPAMRATGVKFRLEQIRSSATENQGDTDHYGIAEIIFWNKKTTTQVFVPTSGAIKKTDVDDLTFVIDGAPTGTQWSSGMSASEATFTLKPTTKIEPIAKIEPDKHIPLLHTYKTCKYLIKAF